MLMRLLTHSILVIAITAVMSTASQAQPIFDPFGLFRRGAPAERQDMYGGSYGGSPVTRGVVSYPSGERPGTIVISTGQRRLYYILGNGQAIAYGIGVGRDGFAWSGVKTVSAKREWPGWTPPREMLRRRPDLPRYMAGGPDNPLGARALYLGSTLYRIHGSNEPHTIGQAVSSGCFRMTNADVIDLYNRTRVGAKVIVR
ncbi:L,D-transpeptidase [Pseudorhodoplanes sp.]|uniref:L,D-transpeptidase n=1 Tax=Pseudorhodoplanes sp. TaxID=1934341 RepID=UPI002B599FF0|nr:L,D-transpeptidase [Pseudorhodoplanes sp.]HWV53974.1 L,D-transpeptidase [Pseudorhodoplanes sp.]